MFGAEERTGQVLSDAWVRTWLPILALAVGIAVIAVGGILFST